MDGSRRAWYCQRLLHGPGRGQARGVLRHAAARLQRRPRWKVLAHELGHFRHRHVPSASVGIFAFSLLALALLGWLSTQTASMKAWA